VFVPSFQISPERGCSAALHVAAMPADQLCAARKYVMRHGYLSAAVNGTVDVDPPLAEALYDSCLGFIRLAMK
jgi:hypothetical protein